MLFLPNITFTQVSFNTHGYNPDLSAMLKAKSNDKGLLIPQIALTRENNTSKIAAPVTSLLICNTTTVSEITPGYYFNSGTRGVPVWTRLATGSVYGSETKVTAGMNLTITEDGKTYGAWYLPSKQELYLMSQNTHVINTTTETNGGGSLSHYMRYKTYGVRSVQAF